MRPMRKDAAREIAVDLASSMIEALSRTDPFPNCITCRHFNEAHSYCVRYSGNPPARTIAYSCGEGYEDANDPVIS